MELELSDLPFYVFGFVFSLVVGGLLIKRTQKSLHPEYDKKKIDDEWLPVVVGYVERFLYTATVLAGFPAFVGIWLVLKTVSQWERFKSDYGTRSGEKTLKEAKARDLYNGYLIKTGISVAYGLAGALIIDSLVDCRFYTAIIITLVIPLAHLLLNIYIADHAVKSLAKQPNGEKRPR